MASRLFFRPLSPFSLCSSLAVSSIIAAPLLLQSRRRYLMDSSSRPLNESFSSYSSTASTPIVTQEGRWNAAALKQVSAGSIFGLVSGLAISVFSKPLALLIGLLIVGVQFVESRGIHIIPYGFLQRRFQSLNWKSAVLDNAAFKLSFGATFALAGFADF